MIPFPDVNKQNFLKFIQGKNEIIFEVNADYLQVVREHKIIFEEVLGSIAKRDISVKFRAKRIQD